MRGRNDACSCGSGLKFKRCCLGKTDASYGLHEADKDLERVFSTGECSHPDAPTLCRGGIVRAHTVPRASVLNRLAVDGHVFGFKPDRGQFLRGQIEPQRVGVRQASTFAGFCGYHDWNTFAKIDNAKAFEFSDEEVFLLTYRAVTREYYLKTRQLATSAIIERGRGASGQPSDEARDMFWRDYFHGVALGVEDCSRTKRVLDEALRHGDFHRVRYCAVVLDAEPSFATSNAVQPEVDFSGAHILVPGSLRDFEGWIQPVAQTMMPTGVGEMTAIFSWVDTTPAIAQLADSFMELTDEQIPTALIRYAFEFSENVFFKEDWWRNLDAKARTAYVVRFNDALNPTSVRRRDALIEDGLATVDWRVRERRQKLDYR